MVGPSQIIDATDNGKGDPVTASDVFLRAHSSFALRDMLPHVSTKGNADAVVLVEASNAAADGTSIRVRVQIGVESVVAAKPLEMRRRELCLCQRKNPTPRRQLDVDPPCEALIVGSSVSSIAGLYEPIGDEYVKAESWGKARMVRHSDMWVIVYNDASPSSGYAAYGNTSGIRRTPLGRRTRTQGGSPWL